MNAPDADDPDIGPPPRRRWLRRLLVGAGALGVLAVVAAGAAYDHVSRQLDRIERIPLDCDVLRNCGTDDPGQPMNVLLVGSDSRSDLAPSDDALLGSAEEVGGQRSDTIIVLRLDPARPSATLLSIPRDLLVLIPGSDAGRPQLINSAFQDGPEKLIATIRQEFGIEIDHYAEVDFNGFRRMVDAVGGVDIYFPTPARDRVSDLEVPDAGCVRLDDQEALAYVRSRHFEYFQDGSWRLDTTSDLGRIQRQQGLIRLVLQEAARAGRNPFTLNALIGNAVDNLKIDQSFSTKDIRRLADALRELPAEDLELLSVPTLPSGFNLVRKEPDATATVQRFLNPPAPGTGPDGGVSLGAAVLASAGGPQGPQSAQAGSRPTPGC